MSKGLPGAVCNSALHGTGTRSRFLVAAVPVALSSGEKRTKLTGTGPAVVPEAKVHDAVTRVVAPVASLWFTVLVMRYDACAERCRVSPVGAWVPVKVWPSAWPTVSVFQQAPNDCFTGPASASGPMWATRRFGAELRPLPVALVTGQESRPAGRGSPTAGSAYRTGTRPEVRTFQSRSCSPS
ncbi:hypothetical protein [Streptomyces sp. NPDC048411]|uniref:hypothetical protein n=1 Tax=Streptomyces sp. NPDC048411 TaxID=3157206 RepID=UPI0034526D71